MLFPADIPGIEALYGVMVDPPDQLDWDPDSAFPHFLPESLDDLQGPGSGRLKVPVYIYWGPPFPDGFDLSSASEVMLAYTEIVTNATTEAMSGLLNKDLLIKNWSRLRLDDRYVRSPWEEKFPELRK